MFAGVSGCSLKALDGSMMRQIWDAEEQTETRRNLEGHDTTLYTTPVRAIACPRSHTNGLHQTPHAKFARRIPPCAQA